MSSVGLPSLLPSFPTLSSPLPSFPRIPFPSYPPSRVPSPPTFLPLPLPLLPAYSPFPSYPPSCLPFPLPSFPRPFPVHFAFIFSKSTTTNFVHFRSHLPLFSLKVQLQISFQNLDSVNRTYAIPTRSLITETLVRLILLYYCNFICLAV